jgi:hypothetical protein
MRKIFMDIGPTRVACWSGRGFAWLGCELSWDWWGHEIIPIGSVVIGPGKDDVRPVNYWGDMWTQDDRDVPAEQEPPVDQ